MNFIGSGAPAFRRITFRVMVRPLTRAVNTRGKMGSIHVYAERLYHEMSPIQVKLSGRSVLMISEGSSED